MQRKIYELNNILKSRCSNSFYLYFLGCSTMFPRIVKSKKKSGTYEYLVISESVHIKGKGSTTRNIANLGNIKRFGDKDIDSLIDGLIKIFKVEKYALSEDVEILESLEYGSIILWRKLWDKMGLSQMVRSQRKRLIKHTGW